MERKKKMKKSRMKNKKAIEVEMLAWWIIALVILVVLIVGFIVLKQKDVSALEFIKNLFRFGR